MSGVRKFLNRVIYITIILLLFSCGQEKSAKHYFSLAVSKVKSEEYHKAVELFTKAIESDSTYGHAYYMKAQVLGMMQADKETICECIKKADEYGYSEAREVLENFCNDIPIDEFNKLKATFDSYIETNPGRFEGYFKRADLYFDVQKFEFAISDYTRVIEIEKHPTAYYNRGLCYLQLGMKNEGCRDIILAAKLGYVVKKDLLELCN